MTFQREQTLLPSDVQLFIEVFYSSDVSPGISAGRPLTCQVNQEPIPCARPKQSARNTQDTRERCSAVQIGFRWVEELLWNCVNVLLWRFLVWFSLFDSVEQ